MSIYGSFFVLVPIFFTLLLLLRITSTCCVCVAMLYRMCYVVSFVVPVLETLAVRCALPAIFYLREVTHDESVLAGVELELPSDGMDTVGERKFFWGVAWCGYLDSYDQASMEAIRFLQGVYGFVIRDFNYDAMLVYRDSMRAAVVVAASAVRCVAQLEREGVDQC